MLVTLLTVLVAAAAHVQADVNPNNPGPGDVLIEGQPCQVSWDIDPTGLWKNMTIELMTGDNFNMVHLTTIGTADGTDPTQNVFSYTCPKVTPHSPIYFIQFSLSESLKAWTGRFTITDVPTDIVPPSESVQPDGSIIPWGTGQLVDTAPSGPAASSVTATGVVLGAPTDVAPSTIPVSASMTTSASLNNATASPTPENRTGHGSNGATSITSASSRLWLATLTLCISALFFTITF